MDIVGEFVGRKIKGGQVREIITKGRGRSPELKLEERSRVSLEGVIEAEIKGHSARKRNRGEEKGDDMVLWVVLVGDAREKSRLFVRDIYIHIYG